MVGSIAYGFRSRLFWIVGFSVWALAIGFGFREVMVWEFRAGESASPLKPASFSGSERAEHRALLVAILHSQCPCSLATLENLRGIADLVGEKLRVQIIIGGPEIGHSDVATMAKEEFGAAVKIASLEEIEQRFGARTSGQVFLYNPSGKLVFSGGVTDGRGSVSDSVGIRAIRCLLSGGSARHTAPVFGCAFATPGADGESRCRKVLQGAQ